MIMPSIQELITKFYQSDEDHSEEKAQAVIDAFLQKETLLVARMPQTKQFFISMESGQQTAIFFSERDIFEKFAVYCHKRRIPCGCRRNTPKTNNLFYLRSCGDAVSLES